MSDRGAGSPLTFKPLTVILASLLAAAVIATVGSLSEVSLGDENAHVRQALKDGEHRCEATIDTPRELYYHAFALVGEGAAGKANAARRKRRGRSALRHVLNRIGCES